MHDRKAKVFQRKDSYHSLNRATASRFLPPVTALEIAHPQTGGKSAFLVKLPLRELTEQALLKQIAPAGALVPAALAATAKGGTVVCAGIHMSDIPAFPYRLLWGERVLRSVANLTRQDGLDFFERVGRLAIRTSVAAFPLRDANQALWRLREGTLEGAAVLVP